VPEAGLRLDMTTIRDTACASRPRARWPGGSRLVAVCAWHAVALFSGPVAREPLYGFGCGLPLTGRPALRRARWAVTGRAAGLEPLSGLPTYPQIVNGELFQPGPVGNVHDVDGLPRRGTPSYHKRSARFLRPTMRVFGPNS